MRGCFRSGYFGMFMTCSWSHVHRRHATSQSCPRHPIHILNSHPIGPEILATLTQSVLCCTCFHLHVSRSQSMVNCCEPKWGAGGKHTAREGPEDSPSPPLPSVYTKFDLSYIFGASREGVGSMCQCGTAESVEKSNHTTPAPPQHLRSTIDNAG